MGVKLNKCKQAAVKSGVKMRRRPYNNITIITTTKKAFDKVCKMAEGSTAMLECPNDVISSARGGIDNQHHSIRRISLVRRQMESGYFQVRVRWEQGCEVMCHLTGKVEGDIDGASFKVGVKRVG